MRDEDIIKAMAILTAADLEKPLIAPHVPGQTPDPFAILVATLLSLRTKDEVTALATDRLLAQAGTPEKMLAKAEEEIARLIYPVGFYRNKAKTLRHVSRELIERYSSRVPDDLDTLLTMKGVGRKTANLVMALGFKRDAICVDIHVHRITNRWGYVATSNPDKTELALRAKLPRFLWQDINRVLVAFGRVVCRPVSPHCSSCPVSDYCDRAGVGRHR